MSRRDRPNAVPDHRHHREAKKMWNGEAMADQQAFGIRRLLRPQTAQKVGQEIMSLQAAGELSQKFQVELMPGISVVPAELIGRQLRRGTLTQDVPTLKRRVKQNSREFHTQAVEADIASIHMRHGTYLNVLLDSPELEEERRRVASSLGRYGVRGLWRHYRERRLCVTLGHSENVLPLGEREALKSAVLETLDLVGDFEEPLQFGSWDMYDDHQTQLAA